MKALVLVRLVLCRFIVLVVRTRLGFPSARPLHGRTVPHLRPSLHPAKVKMATDMSRKSFLTLTPIDFSLTAGTNIPAPLDTPPKSPAYAARPPTAGGGPLSSHPTSAEDIAGTFPPTPEPENEGLAKMSSSTSSDRNLDRADSFQTPASPASKTRTPSKTPEQKQGQSVRKLFSLNNLRNSFSSSRTSLHGNRASSVETSPKQAQPESFSRPPSAQTIQPQMRQRSKSGSWFKRKSGMFMLNGGADLDAVVEDRPATRESEKKVEVDYQPAPLLPEIKTLGNGAANGGDLGWDENMFKR